MNDALRTLLPIAGLAEERFRIDIGVRLDLPSAHRHPFEKKSSLTPNMSVALGYHEPAWPRT